VPQHALLDDSRQIGLKASLELTQSLLANGFHHSFGARFRVEDLGFRVEPEFCFLVSVRIAIIKEAKPDIATFIETIALTV
jgi:hypothetical protein